MLTAWHKSFKRPITFSDIGKKWAPGDRSYSASLQSIADKFDVPSAAIRALNNLTGDSIQIGQKLRIPLFNGVVHTVLSAQTLTEIADRYGVKPEDIMAVAANGITDESSVNPGAVDLNNLDDWYEFHQAVLK